MIQNNPNLDAFVKAFNGEVVSQESTVKTTESFIEKVDAEVVKDKPQDKPKETIANVAKSMKQQLEEGLKEIDQLDPIERSCGLIALRSRMKLGASAFEKLVENLVRMTEKKPPSTFKELTQSKPKVKPIIPDLLGVGLTVFAAEGYTGKTTFGYEIIEAVCNGTKLFGQFEVEQANTLIIQLDESDADFEYKQHEMGLQYNDKNWSIWWSFTPLEFPELEKYVIENNVKVIMMDSLISIAGKEISPKDAEFGILIYRLNQLAGKYGIAIICIHHLNKKANRKEVYKEDIFGTAFIFNGAANCWGFWLEQASGGMLANLKILKSRTGTVDINEQYRFTKCPDTRRHIYMERANGTATLDELNSNKDRVRNLLKDSAFTLFTAKEVNRILNLGNPNYARNILKKLHDERVGIDRVEEKNTVGRPKYSYRYVIKGS